MSKNKEWASHIELVALADVLGVPILVTTDSSDEDNYQVWVYPSNVKTEEVMLLGYSGYSSHYYSLEGTFVGVKQVYNIIILFAAAINLRTRQQHLLPHFVNKKGKPEYVIKSE